MNSILCEITSPKHATSEDVGRIAQYCAIDLKFPFPLTVLAKVGKQLRVSLTVDLTSAISSEAIWHLASRIASFCPHARVSAQINGTDSNNLAS